MGRPVFDRQGRKLDRVYGEDDRAIWGAVDPRFLGRSHMVPLRDERIGAEKIHLAAGKPQGGGGPQRSASGRDTLMSALPRADACHPPHAGRPQSDDPH